MKENQTTGGRPMKRAVDHYDYPMGGQYNETVATLVDGRKAWINTQDATVSVKHADACARNLVEWANGDNVCTMEAKKDAAGCDCGAMDGIDAAVLIGDARANGKFGMRPRPRPERVREDDPDGPKQHGPGWCEICESYCFGDCEA